MGQGEGGRKDKAPGSEPLVGQIVSRELSFLAWLAMNQGPLVLEVQFDVGSIWLPAGSSSRAGPFLLANLQAASKVRA